VLELAWRYGMNDFAFPFFIQMVRDLTHKVEKVEKKHEEREKKDEQKAEQDAFRPLNTMGGMDGLGMMMSTELSPYPMLTGADSGFSSGFPLGGGLGQQGFGTAPGGLGGFGASGLGGFGRPGF
jgi:clathrin heavy chain